MADSCCMRLGEGYTYGRLLSADRKKTSHSRERGLSISLPAGQLWQLGAIDQTVKLWDPGTQRELTSLGPFGTTVTQCDSLQTEHISLGCALMENCMSGILTNLGEVSPSPIALGRCIAKVDVSLGAKTQSQLRQVDMTAM